MIWPLRIALIGAVLSVAYLAARAVYAQAEINDACDRACLALHEDGGRVHGGVCRCWRVLQLEASP